MKDEDNLSNGMSNVIFKVFAQIFVSTFTILNVRVSPWEKILAQQTLSTGQTKFHRSLSLEGFYLCFFCIAIKYCQHIFEKVILLKPLLKSRLEKNGYYLFSIKSDIRKKIGEEFFFLGEDVKSSLAFSGNLTAVYLLFHVYVCICQGGYMYLS